MRILELLVIGAIIASASPDVGLSEIHESRRQERLARGEVATFAFEGAFVAAGLPTEPTRAIPLGLLDLSFVITVRVIEILDGEAPEGWSSELAFAVHSPALYFATQGLEIPAGRETPEGRYRFTLWRSPDGRLDLEVEPAQPAPP